MLTKNGAAAVGLNEMSGSIEVGKRANSIMLDRDIVGDVGEEVMADFENVKALKTWFGMLKVKSSSCMFPSLFLIYISYVIQLLRQLKVDDMRDHMYNSNVSE